MTTLNLVLEPELTVLQRRFAVEVSQLIGFCSVSMEFPFVRNPQQLREDGVTYLWIGNTPPPEPNVVPVTIGDCPAEQWAELYRQFAPYSGREILPPMSFVESKPVTADETAVTGGLEQLFETGWVLRDTDGDGMPDTVDLRLLLEEDEDRDLLYAACNMAARIGMETISAVYPLLADSDDGRFPLLTIRRGESPALTLEQAKPRPLLAMEGRGEAFRQFADMLCNTFPNTGRHLRMRDITAWVTQAMSMSNPDGQAAWIEAFGASKVLLSAGADLEKFRQRWPEITFGHYNDSLEVESRRFDLPSETEALRQALKPVFARLKAGDQVSMRCAIGQDRPERETILAEIRREIESRGATLEHAAVVCAFKQGLSWLEEDFGPRAAAMNGVRRVIIRFNPHQRTTITYHEEDFDWTELDRNVGKPPRWLQDLYPVDEILAEILSLSREDVLFEAYPSDPAATYEALAFDDRGNCLLSDSWTVRTCARPFLNLVPELGPALPTTGFAEVSINGETVLDQRVVTDYESIWDVFQTQLVPWMRDTAAQLDFAPEKQPFFSQFKIEVGLGGPDRELPWRNDHISIGEVLEDGLHQAGHMYFACLGRQMHGVSLDAPGLVLPHISIRPGAPTLRAVMKLPAGRKPSFPDLEGDCICRRVSLQPDGSGLAVELEIKTERQELVPALSRLTEESFTNLSRMLEGYAALHLVCGAKCSTCLLPKQIPEKKDLSIRQIDLMPDRLIGYNDYCHLMKDLERVPGLDVWPVGISYQGRTIYAIAPEETRRGYVSRVKRMQIVPSVLINGRHHANEVSATNAIFAFVRELVTDSVYQDLPSELNLVMVPMENVDGAALHDEMQREHPTWQHQTCYTNSLGADLMPHYFEPATMHTESNVFTSFAQELLPDAFIDLHGVPHHELPQQFGQLTGYHGLWLPRAPLCAFYFHVDDPRFASNRVLSQAWKRKVDACYEGWEEFERLSHEYNQRFNKYSWCGIDESYPCQRQGAMLNYWVPSPYNSRHPYPTVSRPWTFNVMFTAEAADETAHGDWLRTCAYAHLLHVRAGVELLRTAGYSVESGASVSDDTAQITYRRRRPLLP